MADDHRREACAGVRGRTGSRQCRGGDFEAELGQGPSRPRRPAAVAEGVDQLLSSLGRSISRVLGRVRRSSARCGRRHPGLSQPRGPLSTVQGAGALWLRPRCRDALRPPGRALHCGAQPRVRGQLSVEDSLAESLHGRQRAQRGGALGVADRGLAEGGAGEQRKSCSAAAFPPAVSGWCNDRITTCWLGQPTGVSGPFPSSQEKMIAPVPSGSATVQRCVLKN